MTKEEFQLIIDRYLAGNASSAEKRLIDNFFGAQKHNQPAENAVLSDSMWNSIETRLKPVKTEKPKSKAKWLPVMVSVVLLATIGAGLFYYVSRTEADASVWISEQAPYGQKSIITLTDGSKVLLNSGSSISFPREFSKATREIILQGEAFFEVTRNPDHPFVVKSGNVTTKVLGTSFNVQAFAGKQISVTVASGVVQVEAFVQSKESVAKVAQVILNPRQQAVFKDEQLTTSEVDISKFLAWRNNILSFDGASIADVAVELERWYNIDIEFANDKILNCRINGQFKDQSLENVLKSIQYMYNIDFKYSSQSQIVLYGNGCKN